MKEKAVVDSALVTAAPRKGKRKHMAAVRKCGSKVAKFLDR